MTDTLTADERRACGWAGSMTKKLVRLYDAALARAEAAERLHEALFDDNVALRAKLKRAMGVLYWLRTYSGETEKLVAAKLDEALRAAIDAAVVELSCSDDNAPQALTLLSAALGKAGQ